MLSPWADWSPCSVSCGGGNKTRVKTVLQEAMLGGEECSQDSEEVEKCNQQCCIPGIVIT